MPLIRKDPAPSAAPDLAANGRLLTTGSADERWAAARALAGQADALGPLAAALATEEDARVREAILTGLARAGGPAAVDAVLPLLRSDRAELRAAALDALRAMPEATAVRLPALLRDADRDVRILACDLIRDRPADEAIRLLVQVLDEDPEVNVCAAAVDVLAELGTPEAQPALARCAARFPDNAFLGFSIKIAMDRMGSQPPDPRG